MKTKAVSKSLNPQWDEKFLIPNVSLENLKISQLDLQVTHVKAIFSRKQEILGHIRLEKQDNIETLVSTVGIFKFLV